MISHIHGSLAQFLPFVMRARDRGFEKGARVTKIILDRTVFANAENLAEMIRRRGIEVLLVDGWPTDTAEKSPILVISGAAEAAMGGTQKLL